jgi:hypothetical protein
MCDPFDRRRQPDNELLIEYSNLLRGPIFPVNGHRVFILTARMESSQKTFTVRRIEVLGREWVKWTENMGNSQIAK